MFTKILLCALLVLQLTTGIIFYYIGSTINYGNLALSGGFLIFFSLIEVMPIYDLLKKK